MTLHVSPHCFQHFLILPLHTHVPEEAVVPKQDQMQSCRLFEVEKNRRGAETHAKKKGNLNRGEKWEAEKKKMENKRKGKKRYCGGLCSVHFLPPSFSFSFNFRPQTHSLSPTVSICVPSLCISLWFPLSSLSASLLSFFISVQSLSNCRRQQELGESGREDLRKHSLSLLLRITVPTPNMSCCKMSEFLFPPLFWQKSKCRNVSGDKSQFQIFFCPLPNALIKLRSVI